MSIIEVIKTNNPKRVPEWENVVSFGKIFTDHMFLMEYNKSKGWNNPKIVPYAPISLDPSAMCFHYAQQVFEDIKAYKSNNGILLFRPKKIIKRMNESCSRLCIPRIDEDLLLEAVKELVLIDRNWIPNTKNSALYIRTFIFATESSIGSYFSNEFKLCVICSPFGGEPTDSIKPINVKVEESFFRNVRGGLGQVKSGINCAMSLKAEGNALDEGFDHVMWLDGVDRKFVEGIGDMNAFFVIDDKIITPELQGSVFPGITRASVIEMLEAWGYKVEERRISINEIERASIDGCLKEVFASDTYHTISPIGKISIGSRNLIINDNQVGKIAKRLYKNITAVQSGELRDNMGWTLRII